MGGTLKFSRRIEPSMNGSISVGERRIRIWRKLVLNRARVFIVFSVLERGLLTREFAPRTTHSIEPRRG